MLQAVRVSRATRRRRSSTTFAISIAGSSASSCARGSGFDLKNGEGGIREIEFFVQALQLIHGGKRPALRRARHARARSTRCCSRASSPTTSTSRCGARIAGCAMPSTCCSSKAACRRRRFPNDPRRARCSRAGSATRDRRRSSSACSIAHTSAVAWLFAHARRRAGRRSPRRRRDPARRARRRRRSRRRSRGSASATSRRRAPSSRVRGGVPARRCRRPRSNASARIGSALFAEIAASADPDQALRALGDLDRAARRGVVDLAPRSTSNRRSCACSARSSARARTSRARSSTRRS